MNMLEKDILTIKRSYWNILDTIIVHILGKDLEYDSSAFRRTVSKCWKQNHCFVESVNVFEWSNMSHLERVNDDSIGS